MSNYSRLRSHPALVPAPAPALSPLLPNHLSWPAPSLLPPPPTISSHNFPQPPCPLPQPLPDPAGRHHLYG